MPIDENPGRVAQLFVLIPGGGGNAFWTKSQGGAPFCVLTFNSFLLTSFLEI
jgi:hypothetical protein